MEVNDFDIVLFDVTYYLCHVQKCVFNVLIKNKKTNNNRVQGQNGGRIFLNPTNWCHILFLLYSNILYINLKKLIFNLKKLRFNLKM